MKINVEMEGSKVQQYKDGVEAVLRSTAPSLQPGDKLTLNYRLDLGPLKYEQIKALRSIVQMMADPEVMVTATDLDSEDALLFAETGRLIEDLRFAYKERSICGKV